MLIRNESGADRWGSSSQRVFCAWQHVLSSSYILTLSMSKMMTLHRKSRHYNACLSTGGAHRQEQRLHLAGSPRYCRAKFELTRADLTRMPFRGQGVRQRPGDGDRAPVDSWTRRTPTLILGLPHEQRGLPGCCDVESKDQYGLSTCLTQLQFALAPRQSTRSRRQRPRHCRAGRVLLVSVQQSLSRPLWSWAREEVGAKPGAERGAGAAGGRCLSWPD